MRLLRGVVGRAEVRVRRGVVRRGLKCILGGCWSCGGEVRVVCELRDIGELVGLLVIDVLR